jgi:hypothetical protein
MRLYRSDAGWQEHEKDIRADAVIVSMSPDQAIPRHGCIPAEPAAVSPGKIIVPRIVIGGVIFEQACWRHAGSLFTSSNSSRACRDLLRNLVDRTLI